MSWNFRVVKRNYSRDVILPTYQIHEVYYEEDGETIRFCSSHGIDPFGESYDELKENMHQMAEAFHKPVVEWKEEWE